MKYDVWNVVTVYVLIFNIGISVPLWYPRFMDVWLSMHVPDNSPVLSFVHYWFPVWVLVAIIVWAVGGMVLLGYYAFFSDR